MPFEVQIRTWEMHRTAEFGIAAHWKYKEQRSDSSDMDAKLQWLRQVLEWQNETSDSLEFMNTLKVDPVSYTHLDVYKRQILISAACPSLQ